MREDTIDGLWVVWLMGQSFDGSFLSLVKKCDPLSALMSLLRGEECCPLFASAGYWSVTTDAGTNAGA